MTRAILILMRMSATSAAVAEPLPIPKTSVGCPHGDLASGSYCVPSRGAQDAVVCHQAATARTVGCGRAMPACAMEARDDEGAVKEPRYGSEPENHRTRNLKCLSTCSIARNVGASALS